jgi:hypothetical protein
VRRLTPGITDQDELGRSASWMRWQAKTIETPMSSDSAVSGKGSRMTNVLRQGNSWESTPGGEAPTADVLSVRCTSSCCSKGHHSLHTA